MKCCTCPNDCDGNSYAYSMSLKKLDSDAMCRSSFRLRSYLSSPEVSGYPKFMQNFDNMTRDYVYDLYGLCTKTLDELAFVQIQFASSNVLHPTNHSIRRTFLYRFCVLDFPPFFLTVFGAQKGVKNENFGPFF